MASEAQQVLAAGVPVTIGEQELRLIFDFEALEIIEDEFGGLLAFTEALNGGWRGKRLKAVRVGLRAALSWDGATRATVADLTRSLIGPGFAQVQTVVDALSEAFAQAIPAPKASTSGKGSSRASGSRGPASTGSPESGSGARAASSAA